MSFNIRYATEADKPFWYTLDDHLGEDEFALKVRDKRAYLICDGDTPIGVMRYNLFWDNTPFLTLIYIKDSCHGKGFGRQAMLYWEHEMRTLGYKMVMTSTRVDEEAQHFYRKLGYIERGSLCLEDTPLAQAPELFLIKIL
ncbi:MAG: GNAT family N-acetyltransferase [Oscillospiraceae bacterium]|nr:GNAT family N-acetyltransferase [Oscillospiraceae bacterium]